MLVAYIWLLALAMMTSPYENDADGPFCPALCSPDGPNLPWGSPLIATADTIRMVIILLSFIVVILSPMSLNKAYSRGQQVRFFGICMLVIVAATTEMSHIGDTPSYRLVLNLLGVVATVGGSWQFLREVKLFERQRRKADTP
jgi:uncharacterized membrane protein